MGKRWAAGALVALPLVWAALAAPLAWAQGRTEPKEPVEAAAPVAGEELAVVEITEPAGSLEELRAVPAGEVLAEGRDAARWALYRDLLSPGEDGSFDAEIPVSRGEAVQALYRLKIGRASCRERV